MTGVSQHWFSGHFRQVFSTPMHYPEKMATPLVGWSLGAMHEDVGLGGQAYVKTENT
jgi:hypothetical protein